MLIRRICVIIILVAAMELSSADALAQSDWDLYILRLVNRARQDPTGEPGRIGSSITDPRSAVGPLAYNLKVAQAARNHNDWMYNNLGSIVSGNTPDSFTHYETLNGAETGPPATGTPSFTGVGIRERITAAGFVWDRVGENVATFMNTESIAVNRTQIDSNHKGWWESTGHRDNMLKGDFMVFGHWAESWTISPPIGNINPPFDNLHFATQNYARSLSSPQTYIFGLLYDDKDNSGDWTPRNSGDSLREGLVGVSFQVLVAGTSTVAASGSTMSNGAFSANVGNG
ncbi:MAG: hypothetical protein JSV03_00550, partial [Planctomycetota bacterium]